MFAEVTAFGRFDTIENHYQRTKVFKNLHTGEVRQARNWKEAKKLQEDVHSWRRIMFRLPNGMELGNDNFKDTDLVIQWYILLWVKHLQAHPELIEIAKGYDKFVDIFEGKFPYSQAKVFEDVSKYGLKYLKRKGDELTLLIKEYEYARNNTKEVHPPSPLP